MARSLEPGDTVAGYRIETLLGRGGMAAVYLAEHDRLKRKVALKVLSPDLAADETFRRRFVAESERLASVDHPNIIPVYEAGEDDSLLYIAMRYVDTTDLKRLIAEQGSLDPERALSIVGQVAGALDAAHAKGLVHRDVKPANVLVAIGAGADGEDHAYLSDFGLTKRTEDTAGLTRTGYFMGTIDYVAPEQVSGRPIDGRTDQYALGCVLFESLSGVPPYRRNDDGAMIFAHLSEPPPSVTELRPELPAEIDEVIATAMAKNKEDRYPYCVAFARAAKAAILGSRSVTPAAGISSGEQRMAAAIGSQEAAPGTPVQETQIAPPPGIGVPPPPSAPGPAPVEAPAPAGPPPDVPGSRRRLALVGGGIALVVAVVLAFLLLRDDDGTIGDPTGTATGATGDTGDVPPLSEAKLFGLFDLTFSPEGDTSEGSATETEWMLRENCDNRSGPHPCDVDAVNPVTGFIQRVGKTYEGTVSGELPCGSADMQVTFEAVHARFVEEEWRADEFRGQGTMLTGTCANSVFTFVGTLP